MKTLSGRVARGIAAGAALCLSASSFAADYLDLQIPLSHLLWHRAVGHLNGECEAPGCGGCAGDQAALGVHPWRQGASHH